MFKMNIMETVHMNQYRGDRSVTPWSMFAIGSAITCGFSGDVLLLYTSIECPGTQSAK